MGVASLVLGIIGLILNFFGGFGLLLTGLGIIFGALGMKKPEKKGVAVAGLVISIIGTVIGLLLLTVCAGMFSYMAAY